MATLVDTNILVYSYDPRFPAKQKAADAIFREGILYDSLRIPHQALVEFYSVVTRTGRGAAPLLSQTDALREIEEMMATFSILYPNASVVRMALRGVAAYQLPWFDAHLWAYAEHYGLTEIISEDFEHGRLYGSVRVRNPFQK